MAPEPVDSPERDQFSGVTAPAHYEQRVASLERRIAYLERIVKVSQILNSTLSLKPLLQVIIQSATEMTDTEACSIMLLDKQTGELHFEAATNMEQGDNETLHKLTVPLGDSIAGWIVRKRKPLLIRDAKNDPRWHSAIDDSVSFDTHSILGVPLTIRNEVIGVMELLNKRAEDGFGQDDIQIASTLAAQAAIAIENARLLDQLQQAYRELSSLDQLKSDFVSIASHELRTPLAVILGYASFLRDNVSGQASEQLNIVLQSAMKLRSLIDDMVNLRHIEAKELQAKFDIFSLRQLAATVVNEFQELTSAKELTVITNFPPGDDPINIEADRQHVYLIIANLMSNAIKFTAKQGKILVGVEKADREVRIFVADTGIGIPQDKYEQIFDRFFQVEASLTRRYEGMGIGLSIVKGMVEAHNGRIIVDSVLGKGSKFTVILPISPDL
ncbi:MAG: ATP-binding protein [Anaerolineae bacterium]